MVGQVKEYCLEIISKGACDHLPFHNRIHTEEVVEHIHLLAKEAGLTSSELEVLVIAGWFHDTGFSVRYTDHEKQSMQIAMDFLEPRDFAPEKIEKILGCIQSTKMPQKPTTKLEGIMCDADLFHLGTKDFFYKNKLLRKEMSLVHDENCSDPDWFRKDLEFLRSHQFKSNAGNRLLCDGLKKNMLKLKNLLQIDQEEIS